MEERRRNPHPMVVEMANAVAEIQGDMKVLKDRQETTYERLFGNGQPGELHGIKERLKALEQWKWWVLGAAGGIAVVFKVLIK